MRSSDSVQLTTGFQTLAYGHCSTVCIADYMSENIVLKPVVRKSMLRAVSQAGGMMLIGYARVSTQDQKPELQTDALVV